MHNLIYVILAIAFITNVIMIRVIVFTSNHLERKRVSIQSRLNTILDILAILSIANIIILAIATLIFIL